MSTAAYCAPPAANATHHLSPIDTMPWLQVDRQAFMSDKVEMEEDPAPLKGKAKSKRALPKRQTKGRGRKVSPVDLSNEEGDEEAEEEDEITATKKSKSAASKERRRLQNRVAQRSLRARKEEYLQELERKLQEQEEELVQLRSENLRLRQENANVQRTASSQHQSTSSSASSASYPLTDASAAAVPLPFSWSHFAQLPGKAPTPGPYAWPEDLASGFAAAAWQTNFVASPQALPLPISTTPSFDPTVPSSFNLTLPPLRGATGRQAA